jgi:hypothetical protein
MSRNPNDIGQMRRGIDVFVSECFTSLAYVRIVPQLIRLANIDIVISLTTTLEPSLQSEWHCT